LKGVDDDGKEPSIQLASEAELQCTPTGQVATSLQGETVYSLNQKRLRDLKPKDAIAAARTLTGYSYEPAAPKVTPYGTLRKSGYRIEKFTYESEPGILIPAFLAVPANPSSEAGALLYVDGRGKSAAAPRLEQWMKNGVIVMGIDVRGRGENAGRPEPRRYTDDWFGDVSNAFAAFHLGKTLVGMRAGDIARAVDVLTSRPDLQARSIRAIGAGAAGVATLFAAAFDQRINSVELERTLVSYRSVVESRLHRGVLEDVVPGALREFDLPDVIAAMGPKVARVSDPVDAMGDVIPASR
jgi:hypothetical protein